MHCLHRLIVGEECPERHAQERRDLFGRLDRHAPIAFQELRDPARRFADSVREIAMLPRAEQSRDPLPELIPGRHSAYGRPYFTISKYRTTGSLRRGVSFE